MAFIRLREEGDACRIAVEEVSPSYRADLALGKEPGDRNRSHAFLHYSAVMMGVAKEAFASSAAAE